MKRIQMKLHGVLVAESIREYAPPKSAMMTAVPCEDFEERIQSGLDALLTKMRAQEVGDMSAQ